MHETPAASLSKTLGRIAVVMLAACAMLQSAAAQVIDTNRPGFSFTPSVIGQGLWQVETSLGYARAEGGQSEWSLPNAELRYGIGSDVEMFVSGIRWIDADLGSTNASGLGDIGIGTKIALPNYGDRFQSALLFVVSAPTGSDNLTTDRWDPSLGFVWSYSGRIPLAGTARVFDLEGGTTFANGLKLPVQIDERRIVFVEWEANIRESGGNSHWVNTGFQWLLSDDLQVDFAVDFSLTEFGDDFRIAFGFSAR